VAGLSASRCRRQQAGFTLAECVVAVGLLGLVLAGAAGALAASQAASLAATALEHARQLANDTLERADAFGCGLQTGADPQDATEASLCGGSGDTAQVSAGAVPYRVVFRSTWRQIGAPASSCVANPSQPAPGADGLVRVAEVSWPGRTGAQRWQASSYASVPPDAVRYRDALRGAILVTVTSARQGLVTLSAASGTGVTHSFGFDGPACVLFPFLRAGTYRLALSDASGASIGQPVPATVAAGSVTQVSV